MYQAQELLMKAKMKLHKLLRMRLTLVMVMGLLPATAMRGPSGRNDFPRVDRSAGSDNLK